MRPLLSDLCIRRTTAETLIPLRHKVLRPGQPIDEVLFSEDAHPDARHYGALDPSGRLVGCLSLLPSLWQGEVAWQGRAMAAESDWDGSGIGRLLLRTALAELRAEGNRAPIWCHARVRAASLYRRYGWQEAGEVSNHGGAGASVTMVRHWREGEGR